MGVEFQMEITIPTDNEGYVLLKCSQLHICQTHAK